MTAPLVGVVTLGEFGGAATLRIHDRERVFQHLGAALRSMSRLGTEAPSDGSSVE